MIAQTVRLEKDGTRSDARLESQSYVALDRAAYVVDTRAWRSPLATLAIDTLGLGVHDLAANDLATGLAALGRDERPHADSILAELDARMSRPNVGGEEEFASDRGYAEVMEKVLHAAVMQADGDADKAVAMLAAAAAQDDSLPFAFGPPVEIVSPHELAGEYLLEMRKPADAVREYRLALARAPGRTAALIGLATAQVELGRRADARRTYLRAARNLAGADSAAMRAIEPLRARLNAPEGAAAATQ